MSEAIVSQKRCTQCREEKPATFDYFCRSKNNKDGLRAECKICQLEYNRDYNERNREKVADYKREWEKRNHDILLERGRKYRRENLERVRETARKYMRRNPHLRRVNYARYRARKLSLPLTFTQQQWQLCLDYWHNTCAVCSGQLRGLFDIKPNADHWIPLAHPDCPGTTPDNMICLCNKCNQSKNDVNPIEWVEKRYGKRKASVIIQRIETYFDWIKQQD